MATHHGEWFCGAVRIEVVGEPQAMVPGVIGHEMAAHLLQNLCSPMASSQTWRCAALP